MPIVVDKANKVVIIGDIFENLETLELYKRIINSP